MNGPGHKIFGIILIVLFSASLHAVQGQTRPITAEDTAYVTGLLRKGRALRSANPDSAIHYYRLIFDSPLAEPDRITPELNSIGKAYIETVIKALNYTGNIYYFDDQYNRSEEFYRRSYELALAAGLKDYTARALFDLGYNRYKTNDFEAAERLFADACTIYVETGNQEDLFDALNACGLTSRRLGDYESADSSYRQAMRIAIALNDSSLLSDVWLNAGILLCEQGNLEEGIEFFEKALDHYQRAGDRKAASLALLNIGVVMKIVGEYDKALAYILESTAIEELLQQKSQLVIRYFNLADLFLDMGETRKAYDYCRKIRTVHDEIGSRPFEAECDFLYGKYHFLVGEYTEAERYLLTARELAGPAGDMPLMANVTLWIAKTELQKRKYPQSIAMATEAYSLASGQGLILNQKEASQVLADAYERSGDPREALRWYKTFLAHSDSLSYFNQQKEIRRIEARYNYEKKEKENELLRNRASLQEQRLRNRNIITIALITGVALSLAIILLLMRKNRDAKLLYQQQEMINLQHLQEIEGELDGKKRELASKMLFLNQKNELISRLIIRLQEIQNSEDNSSGEILSIVNELRTDAPQSSWKEFEMQFTQVHPGFYQRLYERHPELTSYEQRICAFLRMNLNTREISAITGRSAKSIEVTRSRIRSKFNLSRKDNLNSVLASI